MSEIFKYINSEQRDAVIFNGQYLQINAGPGTGKTTTLAAKILYSQSEIGIDTDKILGISFSRSAKTQLINKLDDLSDKIGYGGKPAVLTFHSLAHRIIKYGIHLKESSFRNGVQIVNTEEFINLEPSLIKGLCKSYADRKAVNKGLSLAYNRIRQGSSFVGHPISHYSQINEDKHYPITTYEQGRMLVNGGDLKKFWIRIIKLEKIRNVTDYQGLISEAIRLLQLKNQTYKMISTMYNYLFVDEYQDTSLAQEELLLSMVDDSHCITIVGDKNQTIYTFNGSNSQNLERFSDYFGNRSPNLFTKINLIKNYRSSSEVIGLANDFIKENNIVPYTTRTGFKPTVVETHSIDLAATYISSKIKGIIQNGEYKPSDICILYRKNSKYSPQGQKVFEMLGQDEIKYRSIQSNKKRDISLLEQVNNLEYEYEDEPVGEVILKLIEKDANKELIDFVRTAFAQGAKDADDLIDYAVELDYPVLEPFEQDDAVVVKTVHDAKGEEYPIVFILYLGDREFPHSSQPDIEEESRLFYVGLTRAQDQLYIIGQKGIHQKGFLDQCLHSNIIYEQYHSKKQEVRNKSLSETDKDIIDKTTEQLKDAEVSEQEELRRLMEFL